MAETTAPPKPRYGKEVVGKRLKVLSSTDSKWRTGIVKAYHGGYYRHLIEFDDGETLNTHLYSEDYEFLPEPGADPPPDVKLGTTMLSVYWPNEDKWFTGRVLAYDGFKHTVRYEDEDTGYVDLLTEKYKILDPSTKSKSSSKIKGEAPAGGQTAAGTAPKQRERQRSVPPQGPGSKTGSASKTSRPTSAAGDRAADRTAVQKLDAADKVTAGDKSNRASADRSPSEKQSSDRSAGAAAAAGAPHFKESKGGSGEKERRSTSTSAAAAAASKQAAAAAVAAANAAAVGAANKKLPLLNMSHVSKKDREAARMLLGFSSPTSQEAYYNEQPLAPLTTRSSGQPAAGNGSGSSAGRLAIAAAAAAAAAAAGLPDPTADFYPPSGGNSPLAADAEEQAAVAAAATSLPAEAAAAVAADPLAAVAVEAGTSAVAALSSELLAGMQWQMQQLVQQEENRWVEVNKLNSQVARLQRERDDAVRARDSALVERDVALAQMKQLQDEKSSLSAQVDNLEREIVNLTSQLSVERGMISNASIDAAQLRVQLTGMRNELAGCKQEATQVIAAIRGIASSGYNTGLGSLSNMGYGSNHAANNSMAAAAAAAMMGMGSGAGGAYGSGNPYGMLDGLDPATAAAVPASIPIKQKSSLTRLGPTQTPSSAAAAAAAAPAAAAPSGSAAARGIEGGRTGGVGQLMQVGPGTLVVGPRRKGLVLDQTAVYTPTSAEAATAQAATANHPADQLQQTHHQQLLGQEREQQLQQEQQQEAAAAQGLAELGTVNTSKPAGGHSSDMNNGNVAAVDAEGADTEHPAADAATDPGLDLQAVEAADGAGLTTSEAALGADDDDSVSEAAVVDQPGPVFATADVVGRRPGRPSRKPSSSLPADTGKGHDGKAAVAGVEAMVGKKRTRGSSATNSSRAKEAKLAAAADPAAVMAPAAARIVVGSAEQSPEPEALPHQAAAGMADGSPKAASPAVNTDMVHAAAAGPDHDGQLMPYEAMLRSSEGGLDGISEQEEREGHITAMQQQLEGTKRQKVAS